MPSNQLIALQNKAKREGWLKWVKSEQDEAALLEGCVFEAYRGDFVAKFFAEQLRHGKGQFAGRPFVLLDWQFNDVVAPLFSWQRPDGTRRFRKADIFVTKKQGKTTLGAGIAAVGLVADDEPGAVICSAAGSREQAAMIYDCAARMIEASPILAAECKCLDSKKRIVHADTGSYYQALAAEGDTVEGLDISWLIQDEIHAWRGEPGRRLWKSLQFSGRARRQPVTMNISTAGDDVMGLGYERYAHVKKIKECSIIDTRTLVVIYEAPKDAEPDDEDVWRACTPSMGETCTIEDMRCDWQEAKGNSLKERDFRQYQLNQWVQSAMAFLKAEDWAKCTGDIDPATLLGKRCCAGLDLGWTDDSTAWCKCFPLPDRKFAFLWHFFLPEDGIIDKGRTDGVDYLGWADQGYYTLTPGASTDQDFVMDYIRKDFELYDIHEAAIDPARADYIMQRLGEKEGLPIIEHRQGMGSMGEPTAHMSDLVVDKRMMHFDDPVMKWMSSNAVIRRDHMGNIKIDKEKSIKKVDGLIAGVMALGHAASMLSNKSIYNTRGILTT